MVIVMWDHINQVSLKGLVSIIGSMELYLKVLIVQYAGYFKNGLRNGKGLWKRIYENGLIDQYQGDYQNDKKSGQGVYVWANGNEYQGHFLDDYKHGFGEMKYFDGRI